MGFLTMIGSAVGIVYALTISQFFGAGVALVGLVFGSWVAVRWPRCGVYVERDGVRVLNPMTSTYVAWGEIERFVAVSYGACTLKRVHGRSVGIFGIQQTAWAARRGKVDTAEAGMIAELNGLLNVERGKAD
jgi:hypothetical protein